MTRLTFTRRALHDERAWALARGYTLEGHRLETHTQEVTIEFAEDLEQAERDDLAAAAQAELGADSVDVAAI